MVRGCRTGILLDHNAATNQVGGSARGQGNVISGNTVGIEIRGTGNVVRGNLIGLDSDGATALPNDFEGIWIGPGATATVIGGAAAGEGNVISGNDLFGISIDGQAAAQNIIVGNLIGTDAEGISPVGNQYGLAMQGGAINNMAGGDGPGEGNVIAGNNTGVLLRHAGTQGNTVTGNFIGYARDGVTPVPNVVDVWITDGASGNSVQEDVQKRVE